MGQRLISLKGQAPQWRGITRLSRNDRGERGFLKLENCYVSADGREIRTFPGFSTFIDLSEINNDFGYYRSLNDAIRPVLNFNAANDYNYTKTFDSASSQTLVSKARPSAFFGFEQIGNEIYIIGESRFREDIVFTSARSEPRIVTVASASGGFWSITVNTAPGSNTLTNAAGAGLNGLAVNQIIYLEGLEAASETNQAALDAEVNGRFHEVTTISGTTIILSTPGTANLNFNLVTPRIFSRIRGTRNNVYPTANGNLPYDPNYDDRPDDPDCLTSWRIVEGINLFDIAKQNNYACWPAWCASRQRDFGDEASTSVVEGIVLSSGRGASRREQQRIKFRPAIEPARDRIIIAAPQSGCMFQIPARIPTDPAQWPSTPTDGGPSFPANGIYDRPRALGLPKPRLISSVSVVAQTSPNDTADRDISVSARTGSPDLGMVEGEYKFAVSFVDPGTGDEGLASEPITVSIPSPAYSTYAYTISINYIHPGYFFPECLALKMNVYIATPGNDALAFYGTFELAEDYEGIASPTPAASAHYGFVPATASGAKALRRVLDIPLLSDTGDLADVLDPTRLAPQSATMPRGAEACRYIRGVLFAGGSYGNSGAQGQLWRNKASARYDPTSLLYNDDEMRIRCHGLASAAVPNTPNIDGDSRDLNTLGIGGRAFPDAYQGVEMISSQLFPGSESVVTVDRVLNRMIFDRAVFSSGNALWHEDVVRLRKPAFSRSRTAGSSPLTSVVNNVGKDVFYKMPSGQVQIGDPGAPNRSSRAFIKIVDPNKGDDIVAIGQLGGAAIFCTRRETYSYSWYQNPASSEPNLMSNEFGCIGTNTMVEFDGGLAWISHRGPVAIGDGLQHVGMDIAEDFYGDKRRYLRDSTGMMRMAWSHHDSSRGLVMWGLRTRESTNTIQYEGQTYGSDAAEPEILSRLPCDEVLIWSYRSGAFSTWRPPTGLEIYWMRDLRDALGITRVCFLAADGRIYALDDAWSDANGLSQGEGAAGTVLTVQPTDAGENATTMTFTGQPTFADGETAVVGRNWALFLRPGMLVELINERGEVTDSTTIASLTSVGLEASLETTIELTAPMTWGKAGDGQRIRIGARPRARITTTFIGSETMDTINAQSVQLRYSLHGAGTANARVKVFKTDEGYDGTDARSVSFTQDEIFEQLGWPEPNSSIPSEIEVTGRRKSFNKGQADSPEIAVSIELTGEAQVRIQDISLEVG